MTMTSAIDGDDPPEALISNRTLFRITAVIGVLAVFASALTVVGSWLGDELALGGHTDSTTIHSILVGQDVLHLPANAIRFAEQRKDGRAESISTYLSWPRMEGFRKETASTFSNPARRDGLIFADFSQSVMSRDMSGRVEPIYSRLFNGVPVKGPAGLTIRSLSKKSGFGDEKLLIARTKDGGIYAVRCVLPAKKQEATSADCLRDVRVGKDLTMLYRFSSTLLPQWQEIDRAMLDYARRHIGP